MLDKEEVVVGISTVLFLFVCVFTAVVTVVLLVTVVGKFSIFFFDGGVTFSTVGFFTFNFVGSGDAGVVATLDGVVRFRVMSASVFVISNDPSKDP